VRKAIERSPHNPSQSQRYLSTFTELGAYTMFVVMMALYVEKH
jgi:hypothetical protein